MKTKIKSDGDEATYFHDKEIPKPDSDCTFLAVITILLLKRLKLLPESVFKRM